MHKVGILYAHRLKVYLRSIFGSAGESFMCCNTLPHAVIQCNTLQLHTAATHFHWHSICNMQHTATRYNTLHHNAAHYNTLPHTAAHCSTMQHTTTHCSTLQHTATHCHTLQHTATHCNTLQHTALQLQHSPTAARSIHALTTRILITYLSEIQGSFLEM